MSRTQGKIRAFMHMAIAVLSCAAAALQAQTVIDTPEQAIRLVADSIAQLRAKQATLPPPKNDSEKLNRMAELDQAPRRVLFDFDLAKLNAADRQAVQQATYSLIEPIDADNQARLVAMVPPEGWFSSKTYGWEASISAFLIVQHSSHDLWRRFLPKIEAMVKTGEADGGSYALMYDRLALSEGRPQRYGSQMICEDGHWVLRQPIEDSGAIDARRKEMGMDTLAENLKRFQNAC